MKTSKPSFLGWQKACVGAAMAAQLVACGSSTGGASNADMAAIQSDVTQPSSPLQSSLSAAGDSLATSDAETGSSTAPDGAGNSKVVDLAAACVAVVTTPSPLDPNNLPQQYSISWTYTNCARSPRGGTVSGTRSVSVTRDANDRTLATSFNLDRAYVNGADLASNGNSTVDAEGLRQSGTVTRTVTGDGNRVFTRASGAERFNHTYTHTLTAVDSYAASASDPTVFVLSQRVVNGTGQLNHNLIGAVSKTTFTDITYQPAACAWPVSGKLDISTTFKDGKVSDVSYTWGAPCGTVTIGDAGATTLTDAP